MAGSGAAGFSGDGGPAPLATLDDPSGVAVDSAGDLFFSDTRNNRVREVASGSHTISTVAGTGTAGASGDGGPATSAELSGPLGVALDAAGDVFIADQGNNRVRVVRGGTISTYAGTGSPAFSGDYGPAANAALNFPAALTVDARGDLLIADQGNSRIRLVRASDQTIHTIAGTGGIGYNGDHQSALTATLWNPEGVAADSAGDVFVGDSSNERIRKIDAAGTITTVAGTGSTGYAGDGAAATGAQLNGPAGVAIDAEGDLFIGDVGNHRVREVYAGSAAIVTIAGSGTAGDGGDGGDPTRATLSFPYALVLDSASNLVVADVDAQRIRTVSPGLFRQAPGFFQPVGTNALRGAGSAAAFPVVGSLSSLYNQSSIWGCSVAPADGRSCDPDSDGPSTDTLDNYSRNEVDSGAALDSSTAIAQLCGAASSGGLPVDVAFTGRPAAAGDYAGRCTGSNLISLPFAADSVAPLVFDQAGASPVAGATICSSAPCGANEQIGPVAAGWRPGNPLGGPYSGRPLTDLTTVGASSVASRIYCTSNAAPVTDWGQLTDTSAVVGNGVPIGVPIVIPKVDPSSDSHSTWTAVVGCDVNARNSDGQTVPADATPLLATVAALDYPSSTTIDVVHRSNQIAETLYFASNGAITWRPHLGTVAVPSAASTTTIAATALSVDGITPSPACDYASNACYDNGGAAVTKIATAHGLYAVVRADNLRASVAGFLNWVCGSSASDHGLDRSTGRSYAAEVTTTLSTTFALPQQPCLTTAIDPFVEAGQVPPSGGAAVVDPNS